MVADVHARAVSRTGSTTTSDGCSATGWRPTWNTAGCSCASRATPNATSARLPAPRGFNRDLNAWWCPSGRELPDTEPEGIDLPTADGPLPAGGRHPGTAQEPGAGARRLRPPVERHEDLGLVMVGRQGWMVDELAERIRSHPLAGTRLLWPDAVTDGQLAWLYQNAFLTIAPSRYEGLGVPVMEALGYGSPTLASTGGALAEAGGDHVETIDPDDTDALVVAIERHLLDPAHHAIPRRRGGTLRGARWSSAAEVVADALDATRNRSILPEPDRRHGRRGTDERRPDIIHMSDVTHTSRSPGFGRTGVRAPRADRALVLVTALFTAIGIALRFWPRRELWLDEALSANIASLPLSEIPTALKHDGHPPLYYFLLHFWMTIGSSDWWVRALSGVISLVGLPLAYLAGRRLGARRSAEGLGARRTGAIAMALWAVLPFAVRYAAETRMYALVSVLVLVGYLLVDSLVGEPRERDLGPPRTRAAAVGLVIVTAALLYSHYWALWLGSSHRDRRGRAGLAQRRYRPPTGRVEGAGRHGRWSGALRSLDSDHGLPVRPHRHPVGRGVPPGHDPGGDHHRLRRWWIRRVADHVLRAGRCVWVHGSGCLHR